MALQRFSLCLDKSGVGKLDFHARFVLDVISFL